MHGLSSRKISASSATNRIEIREVDVESGADCDDLVFVYGSLKRGMNHHQQIRKAVWIGKASITALALYDLGPFPMAVDDATAMSPVQGELYRVSAVILQQLDRFEGVPRLYERHRRTLSDGRSAWVYLGRAQQVRHADIIVSGCWQGPQPHFRRRRHQPTSALPKPAATLDTMH